MATRFPPLNAVRAFTVAARHASFTLAAAELGVTHGAVSRQVKHLEAHLGVPLFVRGIRQIALTPAGRELLAGTAPALERIAAAAEAVSRSSATWTLRINSRPSFAVHWLIPQLPRFLRAHPHIEPQVSTSISDPARLKRDSFDVILRREGRYPWPKDLVFRPFLRDDACPVAAPALLESHPLATLDDLNAHVLLHCATREGDWPEWLALAGVGTVRPAGDLRFEHLQFALQAARDGMGVVLGPACHVHHDVSAGRLREVLAETRLPLPPYCCALADRANPAAAAFARWIEQQQRPRESSSW